MSCPTHKHFMILLWIILLSLSLSTSAPAQQPTEDLKLTEKNDQIIKIDHTITNDENASLIQLFQGLHSEVNEWIGFHPISSSIPAYKSCHLDHMAKQILQMYHILAQHSQDFIKTHINLLINFFKANNLIKNGMLCFVNLRTTENQFFNKEQRKRYKYVAQFIGEYPEQGKDIFKNNKAKDHELTSWKQKGEILGKFMKAFFQYYYLHILSPSDTLSTEFIRALTIRSDIFQHQDITTCISLETAGKLATYLEGLDINNIYINIVEVFNALKYIKFKQQCKTDSGKYQRISQTLQEKWKDVDMFTVMYHDYQPFIEIAAQKFTSSQMRMLARKMAHMIDHCEQYRVLSKQKPGFSSKQKAAVARQTNSNVQL